MKLLLLAFALALALFYGCTEKVDTSQYEQAIKERDSYLAQLNDLRTQASDYESRLNAAENNYAQCISDKASAAGDANTCKADLLVAESSLSKASGSLSKIQASTLQYSQYLQALEGFSALFESGEIPTYSKISAYETSISALNDDGLLQKWQDYINCPSSAVCTPKKDAFKAYIAGKMAQSAAQTYALIKASQ